MKTSTKQSDNKKADFSLAIESIRLFKSNFMVNPEFKFPENGSIPLDPKINVISEIRKRVLFVELNVIIAEKEKPFKFDISYIGLFKLQKDISQEETNKIICLNCAPIMFPYIREHVADITMKAGYPPYHMQPVNFVKIYEDSKAKADN